MALSNVQANNKLIKYRTDAWREYVRENLYSAYMGSTPNSVIHIIADLNKGGKNGGEQINIPLVARQNNQGVGAGTLVGNEGVIDDYGHRCWVDWWRDAIALKKSEQNKSSIDLWGLMKPLLMDESKEKQRDEIIDAFYALPSESAPVGLGSNLGQRVNGILFDAATAAQRNTWLTDNTDRILIGNGNGANLVAANFAASMANITAAMTLSGALINRMVRSAKKANPRLRPYKVKENGSEWFVLFVTSEQFRDAQNDTDIKAANQTARARESGGYLKNPIFVAGDLLYGAVIIREVPEQGIRLPVFYTNAGSGAIQVAPAFLCGQQAMAWCWGQMPLPTFRREDDYGFVRGVGIENCYGVAKVFKKSLAGNLKEWGVYTAFLASVADN